jgi:hypothetical protein
MHPTRRDVCTARVWPFPPRVRGRSMPGLGCDARASSGSPSLRRVSGDAVAVRDRVVLWVLAGGGIAAFLCWRLLGPWPGLILILVTVLVAAVAYRIEAPRIDLHGSPTWVDDAAGDAQSDSRSETIDQ